MTLSVVGRARGLMETLGSWISGKSSQGGVVPIQSLARRAPAPGILPTLLQGRQHSPPLARANEVIIMGSSRRKRRRRRPPQEQPKMNRKLFEKARERVFVSFNR